MTDACIHPSYKKKKKMTIGKKSVSHHVLKQNWLFLEFHFQDIVDKSNLHTNVLTALFVHLVIVYIRRSAVLL